MRWTLWCTLAWAFYYFARLPFSLAQTPPPPHVPPGAPPFASIILLGIVLFSASVAMLSAMIALLLVVPYAFVVARNPERRFWGETAPMGRVMIWLAAVFIPLGIVFGLFSPLPRTSITTSLEGSSVSSPSPHPKPSLGR